MAKHITTVHCVDFNSHEKVRTFLAFLKNNKAKVTAFDQNSNFNTFAIITRYREKETTK